MIKMRFDKLAAAVQGTLYNTAQAAKQFSGVSTDSRTVVEKELFVALKGERFDAHDFVEKALSRNAAGLLVDLSWSKLHMIPATVPIVAVPSTHAALLQLAAAYRDQVAARRIAISGSNGKTTTKEITATILSAFETATYRSPGNLNNLIGAPLSLFAMPQSTKLAVLEAGISIPGEMRKLAALLKPEVVVITNIGMAHIEFLKTKEKIAEEKLNLVTSSGVASTLIINADDATLVAAAKKTGLQYITYGLTQKADIRPDRVTPQSDGSTLVIIQGHNFVMNLFGQYQVYNLLAAYAVATTLGLDFRSIDTTAISFTTAPMRGQLASIKGIHFIVDCYNANPDSMQAGLESFAHIKRDGRKIAVIGDMLELGEASAEEHAQIGKLLAEQDLNRIVLVGPQSRQTYSSAIESGVSPELIKHYSSVAAVGESERELIKRGDLVYLKASRGIELEGFMKQFENHETQVTK